MEDELDDVSDGQGRLEEAARKLLARLQAQDRRGDGEQAVGSDRGARRIPVRLPVPAARRRARSARMPDCARRGAQRRAAGAARGQFGAFIACSNYPECKFTPPVRAARRRGRRWRRGRGDGHRSRKRAAGRAQDRAASGRISSSARARRPSARASPRISTISTSNGRSSCWRCRASSATHPDSGLPIEANIGRYGPYLRHDGKYGKLANTREVFEVGMNRAVDLLAQAANRGAGGGRAGPSRSRRSARIPPAAAR